MAIQIEAVKREFMFNSKPLPDPGSEFSVEEVRDIYTAQYPDLSTALLEDPVVTEDCIKYVFVRNVGTKG